MIEGIDVRERIPGSFRDPDGVLFSRNGVLYRQVNPTYKDHYDHLIHSGLYRDLVERGLLIPHEEADHDDRASDDAYKILKPAPVPFISYPYEWSFSQLKHAALTTLSIQRQALAFGMYLKDASAYNIQFRNGTPILIDTLSFEQYREGYPWVAYRQFCQHFLAPLALMAYRDVRLSQLLRVHLDGIPLDLTASLLPYRSYLRLSFLTHIHLHAGSQRYFAERAGNLRERTLSRAALSHVIHSLEAAIHTLRWTPGKTEWTDYYRECHYSPAALRQKKQLVAEFLDEVQPRTVWDLAANTGLFSRIASERGIQTVSCDNDPAAVEANYLDCVERHETNMLPLWVDITNPSPGVGWENQERASFFERGHADCMMALALVHHLAIGNHLSFDMLAEWFSRMCRSLVIEFVPRNDPKVQRLLSTRTNPPADYHRQAFEDAFASHFTVLKAVPLVESGRLMYLMKVRHGGG